MPLKPQQLGSDHGTAREETIAVEEEHSSILETQVELNA